MIQEKPDILLLDEPTNYLDEEHIAWLKRYLLDYENAFILISHDIPFLNEVVNIIYHMENQELYKMIPYVVTLLVLIITSMRSKRENQPPASLGLAYFREER